MTYKPVDTAITMIVGPLIDDTDFKSLEEAIAYNAAGMDVSLVVEKTDGTTAVTAITLTTGGTSDWTHKDGGYYEIEVTAAQNIEEGIGYIRGVCDGVLPFESIHYNIVKANIYDSWIKGTDILQSDVTQLGGVTQSATDLKDFADAGYDPATTKINGVKLTDTTTTNTDMRGTDSAALASICTNTRLAELDAGNIPFDINCIKNTTGNILTDTSELQADWANGGRLDNLLDAIPTTAMRGTDGANTTTPPTVTAIRTEMDNNSTKMAPSQTLADYKATGFNTTVPDAAGTLASYDPPTRTEATADKDAIIADLLTMKKTAAGTWDRETDSLEAIRDQGDTAWVTGAGGSAPTVGEIRTEMEGVGTKLSEVLIDTTGLNGDAMVGTNGANTITPPTVIEIRSEMDANSTKMARLLDVVEVKYGLSVNDISASTTKFISTLTEGIGFPWGRAAILFTSGANDGLMRRIKAYNGTTKEITLQTALHAAPVNGDTFVMPAIRAFMTPDIEDIADQMMDELIADHTIVGSLSKAISDGLEDTNNLQINQGNWVTATGFATENPPSQNLADYKATGFSTHSATDIWSSITRSLTDKNGFALSTSGIKAIWDQLTSGLTTIGSLGKLFVDNINATISSRSPSNEYDTEMGRLDVVVSTRNAIAPNIVIPDIAGTAATLHGITDGKIDVVDGIVDAIKLQTDNLPSGITKNEALPKFDFLMVLSSDHVSAATGKTVTGEISKDGGTFATITNTITEVSSGMYTIADGFTATEMNADIITLKFDADDSDTRIISIITT